MSLHGWTAVQMWALGIADMPARESIAGFFIITRHLSTLAEASEAPREVTERLRTGFPEDVSRDLLSLEGTEAARKLGTLVTPRLERRLMEDARRLRRLASGPATPIHTLFRFGFRDAPTETLDQLLGYETLMGKRLEDLTNAVARLSRHALSQPHLFAISKNFLVSLEECRQSLATLQSHYRKIINSPVALADSRPQKYRAPLENLEQALRELEMMQAQGFTSKKELS